MNTIEKIVCSHLIKDAEIMLFNFNPKSNFLKLIVDSPNDISIDEIAELAKNIKNDYRIINRFPDGLRLEVGTPGVGSKLEKKFQYHKNIGRMIELEFIKDSELIKKIYCLKGVNDNSIIVIDGVISLKIKYSEILNAKVQISFD